MLNIDIICIGRLKEHYWNDACLEYAKRLTPWAKVRIAELSEERLFGDSAAQIDAVLAAEGERILAALPQKAYAVALCVEGKRLSSPALSKELSGVMLGGKSEIAFVIGGSFGLSQAVKDRAQLRLSMSDLTFPHQLARVMLLEQIYRCMSMLGGGKYHK
jgi:23S rRNA (pseudouridine1915-N3)-methyltransferase